MVANTSTSQKHRVLIVVAVACLVLGLALLGYGLVREAPKRVARTKCAGSNQTVTTDTIVRLVGNHPNRNSGRADPNGKTLSYSWELNFLDAPNDSAANLSDLTGPVTSFIADVPGTFQATLWITNNNAPFIYCRTPDTVKILVKD